MSWISRNKLDSLSIGILVLFHIIGVVLMLTQENGAELSYLNLLLCSVLIFLGEHSPRKALISLLIIYVGGYLIEYIGVHTGVLFGEYQYGNGLSTKYLGIPLIIGLNWFIIVASSTSVAQLIRTPTIVTKTPDTIIALIAGALCTGLDFLIEPVAIKFDYWSWTNGEIPSFNYITWFGFASIFSFIYLKLSSKVNRVGQALFVIWVLFFTILNLV